ncbi:unnamed protein product [Toxocara canis]|uniref:ULP_PROTEASE domain-containing protein n=1 Tax=Toxocara canis TaxID=6265 RepID=A0A183TXS5_TOXCA|nr:unnamed protein product [Toxocara canis]
MREVSFQDVADWEKIYDLPPHSSTVTIKDVPPNVDVKRRLAQFEGVMPYFDTAHRSKIGRDEDARSKRTPSPVTGYHTRNSTPSTSRERTERTVHVSRSANATPQQFAVPVRGSTEFAMMGSTRSIPLPMNQKRASETARGVTDEEQHQMMRKNLPLLTKQEQNADLDELARLNEKLLERSRGRRADYKLVDSEIVKTAPEPVPPSVKQPRTNPATVIQEQIREMLESRISNDTSVNSTIPQQDRSGYVTDVSSATWQFSTQSFSPRSVVSINGGAKTDDGLLKVRTDLSPGLSRTISRSNAAVQTANVIESNFNVFHYDTYTHIGAKAARFYVSTHLVEGCNVWKEKLYRAMFGIPSQCRFGRHCLSPVQNEKQSWPYMPAQLGTAADSAHSTITREFNETYTRRIDRYASLPTLDASDARGTLIKIKDDKPRGIMKRRELETKDQMMYADQQPRNLVTQNHWEQREVVQTKPKVTETVQKFEEHKRTEEIERRVQRKERREKKHRSAQRSYHHSGGQEMLGYSDGGLLIFLLEL